MFRSTSRFLFSHPSQCGSSISNSRRVISLGGWCGPALMLGKLGYRTEAYPLDFSRCTLDGIIHFIRNGFSDGFYPPTKTSEGKFVPECVGIWVLFRGQHTAFAHFDLNSEKIKKGFQRKMERWDDALDGKLGPLNLFRTVTAKDPKEELNLIPELEKALLERTPNLDFRLSVIVHDQGLNKTTLMEPLSERSCLWNLEYGTNTENKTLFDRSHDGYEQIVQTMIAHDHLPKSCWPIGRRNINIDFQGKTETENENENISENSNNIADDDFFSKTSRTNCICKETGKFLSRNWKQFPWRSHDNIALIDGVASVAGTCTGIGSTAAIPNLNFLSSSQNNNNNKISDDHEHNSNEKNNGDEDVKKSCGNNTNNNNNFPFKCNFCGDSTGHRANRPAERESRPFTQDEDEVLVAHLCKILVLGSDRVEAVESIAHELGRGSFEVVCRLQHMTNSSLKLTEGLADQVDDETEEE